MNKKLREERNDQKKRTKERKIGDVVDKVREWRILYNDGEPYQGRKYSLDQAANAVGMSK